LQFTFKEKYIMFTQTKLAIALCAALGISSLGVAISASAASTSILARNGADDKPGDVKGEGAGHPNQEATVILARRGRGADDKPGDVKGEGAGHPNQEEVLIQARRGRGADDKPGDDRGVHGAGHPNQEETIILSRRGRGADDPAGHQRREDRRADRRQT
jgi:hypothetical protein